MIVGLFTTEIYANCVSRKNWRGGFSLLDRGQKQIDYWGVTLFATGPLSVSPISYSTS